MEYPSIQKFIDKMNEDNYSDATIKTYRFALLRIQKLIKKDFTKIDFDKDFNAVITSVKSIGNNNSEKLAIIALIKYFKLMDKIPKRLDDYVAKHGEYKQSITAVEIQNNFKDKEVDTWVEWTEMKKKFVEYVNDKNITKRPKDIFILGCLLLLDAPTRIGNYQNLRILKINPAQGYGKLDELDLERNTLVVIETDKKVNYQFVFGDYKTAKTLGAVVADVKDPLLKEIITMTLMDGKDGDVMFAFTNVYITQILRNATGKIYGKSFSVDLIRHSFITWFLAQQTTTAKKIETLKLFGQKYNPNQADLYQRVK
jgi:hypothetical protein